MEVALKIILLIILVISFLGAFGETERKDLRTSMTAICLASIFASVAAFSWL